MVTVDVDDSETVEVVKLVAVAVVEISSVTDVAIPMQASYVSYVPSVHFLSQS